MNYIDIFSKDVKKDIRIKCIEQEFGKNNFSKFVVEPLNAGQGLTLGNSLRRTLLTSLTGTCITAFKANVNLVPNFKLCSLEDIFDIALNLRKITLYSSNIFPCKAFLSIKGPAIVKAKDINLPKFITLCNPEQYIATITNGETLNLELIIERGRGYKLADEALKCDLKGFISIDAKFSPVIKVNYKVKLKNFKFDKISKEIVSIIKDEDKNDHFKKENDKNVHENENKANELEDESFKKIFKEGTVLKESLFLEIWTNKAITPKRALLESSKLLITLFSGLLRIE